MAVHRWQIAVASFGMSGLALVSLSACQGPAASPTPPAASPAAQDQATAGVTGSARPASPNSAAAAQAYAQCLSDAGVPAMIVEGNRVVLTVATGQPGGATASSPTKAEQRCHAQVPAYREPNFNER